MVAELSSATRYNVLSLIFHRAIAASRPSQAFTAANGDGHVVIFMTLQKQLSSSRRYQIAAGQEAQAVAGA